MRDEARFTQSADELGIPTPIAKLAYEQLQSGKVKLLAVNGKLSSGKDTVAPAVMAALHAHDPFHLYYATALKDEIDAVITTIAATTHPDDAIEAVARSQEIERVKAAFVVGLLWSLTRSEPLPNARSRTPEIRTVLQYWGTEVRRSSDAQYWVKRTLRSAMEKIAEGRSVYITDVRFPNEVEWAQRIGFTVVRLEITEETQRKRLYERDGLLPDAATMNHPSETGLDQYRGFDLIVDNNGDLSDTVGQIAESMSSQS